MKELEKIKLNLLSVRASVEAALSDVDDLLSRVATAPDPEVPKKSSKLLSVDDPCKRGEHPLGNLRKVETIGRTAYHCCECGEEVTQ